MNSIKDRLERLRDLAIREDGSFGLVSFTGTRLTGILSDVFRVFTAISPDKLRKPGTAYSADFDKHHDILFDTPFVISSKLGREPRRYNSEVTTQLGVCDFRCWYCYVNFDLLSGRRCHFTTASELVSQFLNWRSNSRRQGGDYNVLRISGGEPFLAPELILQCLQELKARSLDTEVFVKSETNLSPFILVDDRPLCGRWVDLSSFSKHSNFLLIPSFHGIDNETLGLNCQVEGGLYEYIIGAIKTLIDFRIDIYPSLGSNTVPYNRLERFFCALAKIHNNLPLRIALRPRIFDYPETKERMAKLAGLREMGIFSHSKAVEVWDRLLRREYGVGYAEIPRERVLLW